MRGHNSLLMRVSVIENVILFIHYTLECLLSDSVRKSIQCFLTQEIDYNKIYYQQLGTIMMKGVIKRIVEHIILL